MDLNGYPELLRLAMKARGDEEVPWDLIAELSEWLWEQGELRLTVTRRTRRRKKPYRPSFSDYPPVPNLG